MMADIFPFSDSFPVSLSVFLRGSHTHQMFQTFAPLQPTAVSVPETLDR